MRLVGFLLHGGREKLVRGHRLVLSLFVCRRVNITHFLVFCVILFKETTVARLIHEDRRIDDSVEEHMVSLRVVGSVRVNLLHVLDRVVGVGCFKQIL